MKDVILDLIYQFGYHTVVDGKPAITTGGLSALESAFSILGIDDPYFIDEEGSTCEIDGCMKEICSGQSWGDLYLTLCMEHSRMLRNGEPRPKVKKYAIRRESTRDPKTGWLPSKTIQNV